VKFIDNKVVAADRLVEQLRLERAVQSGTLLVAEHQLVLEDMEPVVHKLVGLDRRVGIL